MAIHNRMVMDCQELIFTDNRKMGELGGRRSNLELALRLENILDPFAGVRLSTPPRKRQPSVKASGARSGSDA
jgi:hypothetical protein